MFQKIKYLQMVFVAKEAAMKKARSPRLQKTAINLTDKAVGRLKYLLIKQDSEFIRLGVKTRGCNGLSYTMSYTNENKKFDELVEQDGVRILVDPGVLMHVIGTQMDFFTDRLRSEFVFINPNSKGECGCGESFTV
jgi:iron-sulfur cluster assembly protein